MNVISTNETTRNSFTKNTDKYKNSQAFQNGNDDSKIKGNIAARDSEKSRTYHSPVTWYRVLRFGLANGKINLVIVAKMTRIKCWKNPALKENDCVNILSYNGNRLCKIKFLPVLIPGTKWQWWTVLCVYYLFSFTQILQQKDNQYRNMKLKKITAQ